MTVAAKYENRVFKPLEEMKLTEGSRVQVHVAESAARPVRKCAAFRMWADREDIPDGVTCVNLLREPRYSRASQ